MHHIVTINTMSKLATILTTTFIFATLTTLAGCSTQGPDLDLAKPDPQATQDASPEIPDAAVEEAGDTEKITFEVPEEWKLMGESTNKGLSYWSGYIPDPPETVTPAEAKLDESEQQHSWKFTLSELDDNSFPPGNTPKAKAEAEYQERIAECSTEEECTIKPVQENTYGGINTYTVEAINRSEQTIFRGEFVAVFFEKDDHMFRIGIRGVIDDPVTQQTVENVIATLNIEQL